MLESYADCGVLRFDLDDEGLLNSVVDEVSGLYLEVFAGTPASNWPAHSMSVDAAERYIAYWDDFGRGRIQDAWKSCPSVRKIALHPTIVAILHSLYGEEPRAFQTLNFKFPTQQQTHTDSVHFSNVERDKMCGVWIALEDIDRENGPLMYYPGLHNMWHLNNLDGFESHHDWECMIQKTLKEYEPEYGIMKKGEGIVWSANLLHGGTPTVDPNRTRWSQVTHYYFGDGPFYSPLGRRFHGQEWKSVDWIE